jgi:menaquinone-dependent protoporphyrinogen IX oxidase
VRALAKELRAPRPFIAPCQAEPFGTPHATKLGMAGPRILIIYFSRTGTTRRVAESIARATHGDVEELREPKSRLGPIGWLRSGYEGSKRLAAETLPLDHELERYELVFVGSPTWSRSLSSPVRGFLERNRRRLPGVALFATCGDVKSSDAVEQMVEVLGRAPVATLTLAEADAKRSPAVWVGEFVEAALSAWERQQLTGHQLLAQASG